MNFFLDNFENISRNSFGFCFANLFDNFIYIPIRTNTGNFEVVTEIFLNEICFEENYQNCLKKLKKNSETILNGIFEEILTEIAESMFEKNL